MFPILIPTLTPIPRDLTLTPEIPKIPSPTMIPKIPTLIPELQMTPTLTPAIPTLAMTLNPATLIVLTPRILIPKTPMILMIPLHLTIPTTLAIPATLTTLNLNLTILRTLSQMALSKPDHLLTLGTGTSCPVHPLL